MAGRPGTTRDDDLLWTVVTPKRPCPVCGAVQGCGVAEAEGFVLCRATPSPHPVDVGRWLHPFPGRTG